MKKRISHMVPAPGGLSFRGSRVLVLSSILVVALLAAPVQGKDFCVQDSAGLSQALRDADDNLIHVTSRRSACSRLPHHLAARVTFAAE